MSGITSSVRTPFEIAAGLRRVVAPNPSAMTAQGTNTYLLGTRDIAVIDPGPDDPAHLKAIMAALPPRARVSHIFVTHAHLDHSGLAPALSRATGAPVLAFGDATAGRRVRPWVAAGTFSAEGLDRAFRPDEVIGDGAVIETGDWRLTALHTPGHLGGHLAFLWGEAAFSSDHAMGWATSLIAPPDGDMADYMASLDRLAALRPARLYPGHGPEVPDAPARLAGLISHRRSREAEILAALAQGPANAASLARAIYRETPATLLPAAARNVLAHLIDLTERNVVVANPPVDLSTRFALR